MFVPFQVDMSAASAVAAVGPAAWFEFFAQEMTRARAALSGAAADLDVVYEISVFELWDAYMKLNNDRIQHSTFII